ncbi:Na+/H+ antiporter NhaA [Mucilaginibacter pallidiroseus]|uniref:Na(+)/H(+) antiporter NhaA n=1 Tax=Mucilaginibacter pallidiroseus TaxID=2599295 RepID=A0A563UJF6_9SPHI|nr:Na+/H+ antiporter NhaA [Mucilaginibacter pallidiroseus]TWR31418.1 Na+/H+ antiporter NhaA [Mucilaginibacter pallidiroseus]
MIKNLLQFTAFIKSNATGGRILIFCIILSLVMANSSFAEHFNNLLATHIGPKLNGVNLRYTTLEWINDGLMAIFFLLVGLEIKDEALNGELSDIKSASLPIFAAIGGMLIPALLYWLINKNTITVGGWGIPMATDIAFVVAIINTIKSKVPLSLQVFIKALAIVDDLGAIIVIAIFYNTGMHSTYLLLALAMFVVQLFMNKLSVRYLWAYIIPGVFMWYFVHHSGIHATIAGVLTAIAIPHSVKAGVSPLKKLIHLLENPVNYFIIPVFAIANANIDIAGGLKNGTGISALQGGILLGLILGKPVGITLFSWIAVKLKLSKLSEGVRWPQVWGIGQLAGIGFTMSIFMALLSFSDVELQNTAKLTILIASLLAAFFGYVVLNLKKIKA